ncbi:MAG: urease accessory protein UreD [Hydrogenophaga sp.]|uniref:urease accessory protein UreD n=1 Tax=Hydrogenophaga sp. TaxID=1904254 RepID=UPI0016AA2A1D|nr:urease accessory protein UreD [Hydrogenophaga sp.]NIM42642.1 urease accessory protein UreD [Hydrogenophaga sp.]NIN25685.1 urease accessory protein UreD [Hydrogenophaga sp.]NIN30347.1 urease accessory protein UreD [Hydrogenophaga sp.]NIN56687.1 urease accessory protein UreD [Hydrogenophaga sp.]NIO53262.1 urease accessory protein UreD [Hydrogenophaga sp.]
MPWHAHLDLSYRRDRERTTLQHRHDGPLRILKSLYPEGEGICHNVVVHPPGGLVGGDTLDIRVRAEPGAHALISTPGATRFYRSDGPEAAQRVHLSVAEGARLEWLPLEAIAYPDCQARNALTMDIEPGGECLGWDVCALGLPAAGQAFTQGRLLQEMQWPGVWLERALIDAGDTRLLDSPLGLAGQRALGTLWLARGTAWPDARREALLDAARAALAEAASGVHAGATSPDPRLLVVRALAPQVEPLMATLQRVWASLRVQAWALGGTAPRIWRV